MLTKKFTLLPFLFFFLGCGNITSLSSKGPPPAPPLKPTPECLQAKAEVDDLLKPDPGFFGAFENFLSDGRCFVGISVDLPQSFLPIAKKLKATFGKEVSIPVGDTHVPLWISEPRTMWVPVLDPDTMKPLDNQETLEECEKAAQYLRTSFPKALITFQKSLNPRQTGQFCYLDLAFKTDEEFENFLGWPNPYSFDQSLFYIHFQRPTGVVATVGIYAHTF